MKRKMSLLAITAAAAMMLGGCGTQMYALSEDEENLIVQYSAQMIAKYNIGQKDGMTAAVEETETAQEETPDTQTNDTQTTPENGTGSDANANTDGTEQPEMETISLAEAIGSKSKLKVSYKGFTVKNIYQEGDYFAVTPDDGNQLVILKFRIKNSGKKTVKLDTASMDNPFYASFDGGSQIEETVSMGVQSLSSYDGKIKAGQTKTAVLLFQIPKKQSKKISDVALFVKMNDTIYSVSYK